MSLEQPLGHHPGGLMQDIYLILPEFVDDGLVKEEFDILEEVEGPGCGGAFVHLLLVLGLVGVNPLQDAEASGNGDKGETCSICAPKSRRPHPPPPRDPFPPVLPPLGGGGGGKPQNSTA